VCQSQVALWYRRAQGSCAAARQGLTPAGPSPGAQEGPAEGVALLMVCDAAPGLRRGLSERGTVPFGTTAEAD